MGQYFTIVNRMLRYLLHPRRLAVLIEIVFLILVLHLAYQLVDRVLPHPLEEPVAPRVPISLERYRRSP